MKLEKLPLKVSESDMKEMVILQFKNSQFQNPYMGILHPIQLFCSLEGSVELFRGVSSFSEAGNKTCNGEESFKQQDSESLWSVFRRP